MPGRPNPQEELELLRRLDKGGLSKREELGILKSLQGPQLSPKVPPSRTGLIPQETRQEVRDIVRGESFLGRLILELSPAAIGTFIGGVVGTAFVGVGTVPGAVLGGLLGEFIGQEVGMTPQSDVGLAFAAGGPVAGRLAAPIARGVGRGIGGAITSVAPAKAAVARKAVKEAVDELSSFGARVLAKQKGIMQVPASKIYNTVRGFGVQIDPKHSLTMKTLNTLESELGKIRGFPEVAQALRTIRGVKETLGQESISFADIITTKQLVGAAVKKAERAVGFKLRTPKAIFKAMSSDIDALAVRGKGLKGVAARLLKKANARAKLEFSVGEFEEGLAQNLTYIPKEGSVVLKVNGLRNWIRRVTDPNHKQFNKNFTEGLKDEIPDLNKRLAELDKITETLNPAGPGSIVIRGVGAGAGGALGLTLAGAPGATIGAIGGASFPEMLVGIFLSKPGMAVLARATTMGRGTVSEQAWAQLGQILAQAIKPESEVRQAFGRRGPAQVR